MTNGNGAREKALNNWTQEVEGTSIEVTNMMRSAYRDGWEDCRKLCADQPSEATDANYGGKGTDAIECAIQALRQVENGDGVSVGQCSEAIGKLEALKAEGGKGGEAVYQVRVRGAWQGVDKEDYADFEGLKQTLYTTPQAECAPRADDCAASNGYAAVTDFKEVTPRAEGPCEIDNFSSRVCQRGTRCCIADHIVPRADAETIGNLLARIHRDGGHYQTEHGTIEAIKAAEREVVKLRADAEKDAALTDEQLKSLWALAKKMHSSKWVAEFRAILAANKE